MENNYCSNCGVLVNENDKYCSGCGTYIEKKSGSNNINISNKKESIIELEKKNNGYCLTGFIFGIMSLLTAIGGITLLAIIFSSIGLFKFEPIINKNKWQGFVGLGLGSLYFLVYLFNYGYI